jgi:hypothetical protein
LILAPQVPSSLHLAAHKANIETDLADFRTELKRYEYKIIIKQVALIKQAAEEAAALIRQAAEEALIKQAAVTEEALIKQAAVTEEALIKQAAVYEERAASAAHEKELNRIIGNKNLELMRAKGLRGIRGGLEYLKEGKPWRAATANKTDTKVDGALNEMLKTKEFGNYFRTACSTNNIKLAVAEMAFTNLFHKASMPYHGNPGGPVIVVEDQWDITSVFCLATLFEFHKLPWVYLDSKGKARQVPFQGSFNDVGSFLQIGISDFLNE